MKNELQERLDITISKDEFNNLLEELYISNDFNIILDGLDYRFINEDAIESIHFDEVKEQLKDCYAGLNELPWFIKIDWDDTIENIRDADGYGHHFSTWDGSEEIFKFESGESYYIFRI
jgi:hypothetical protein